MAIVAKSNIQLAHYPDLEPSTAVMLVCVANLGGNRYFTCSTDSPSNNLSKFTEIKETLRKVADQSTHLRVSGILLLGDQDAHREAWGDHNHNKAGESLLAFKTGLKVIYLHDELSYIYLLICSNNRVSKIQNQYTDSSIELFTGAPHRGHLLNYSLTAPPPFTTHTTNG